MRRRPPAAAVGARGGRGARAVLALWLGALAALSLAGCGGGAGERAAEGDGGLVVSAATSLRTAFERYADARDGGERLQFAGSDALAAQLRNGVRSDVIATADVRLATALHRDGLVERPVPIAANELVIATAADRADIRSLDDLAHPGTTVALGSPTVPVGAYARAALGRLEAARRDAILANVRSEEPDVGGVVGKVAQGAVDAGFVYATDVAGAGGRLRAVRLPARLRPQVTYVAAVVRDARHARAARAYVAGLRRGAGAAALRAAGFGPPPASGAADASDGGGAAGR